MRYYPEQGWAWKWVIGGSILVGAVTLFAVLAQAEDLPACCGRLDSAGWANNLPPQDSVRFGQQSLHSGESQNHIWKDQTPRYVPSEGSPNFNLHNLEGEGYNPETGRHVPRSTATPDWYKSDKEWASHNLKKYWNLR